MNFRIWLEIAEPNKPSNSIMRRNVIKNKGTYAAHEIKQFQFKTKLGNIVKAQFEPSGDDRYSFVFYVNDNLKDDAKNSQERDPEILSGVLHILLQNKLNAKEIAFTPFSGEGDVREIKNANIEVYKSKFLHELDNIENSIKTHKITMIEPSQTTLDIYRKQNKPVPTSHPDFNISKFLNLLDEVKNILPTINQDQLNDFYNKIGEFNWHRTSVNSFPLFKSINNLMGSLNSHTDIGWRQVKNRRAAVYDKLVNRYLSKDWNISKGFSRYTLTKKVNENQDYYAQKEPILLSSPIIKQELNQEFFVKMSTIQRVLKVSEGESAFLARTFNKKYGNKQKEQELQWQRDKQEKEKEEKENKDDYLYHVTTMRNLPRIKQEGLVPGKPSQFTNYKDYSINKIFLTEKGGISYWKGKVEEHESHNRDHASPIVVLKIPKHVISDLKPDRIGTEDSGYPSYYINKPISREYVGLA